MNDYMAIGPVSWALFQRELKRMSKLQRMNAANRSTQGGRGAYHDNPHKDGPAQGNPTGVVQGKSVKQGRSAEPADQANQGYAGKLVK